MQKLRCLLCLFITGFAGNNLHLVFERHTLNKQEHHCQEDQKTISQQITQSVKNPSNKAQCQAGVDVLPQFIAIPVDAVSAKPD